MLATISNKLGSSKINISRLPVGLGNKIDEDAPFAALNRDREGAGVFNRQIRQELADASTRVVSASGSFTGNSNQNVDPGIVSLL